VIEKDGILKKPQTAYWLWLGDNRQLITTMLGTAKGSDVAKKGGEMWKALSDADRQPYEKKAKEQKDAYNNFIATDEGKQARDDKKAAKLEANAEKAKKEEEKAEKLAAKEERNNERACKAALKAIEKDDALKKPQSAYWLWLGENRESIVTMLGTAKGPEVAKKGGEMWKALSDADRQPYEKKAREQKEAYDKYVASDEGAAKLNAFKEARKAAKDQFKPKNEAKEEEEEEESSPQKDTPKKRAKSADTSAAPPSKRGRGAKSSVQEEPTIPAAVLKEAEALNMVGQMRNLMARADVMASGKSPQQMLGALQECQGLVNKAKARLLGA